MYSLLFLNSYILSYECRVTVTTQIYRRLNSHLPEKSLMRKKCWFFSTSAEPEPGHHILENLRVKLIYISYTSEFTERLGFFSCSSPLLDLRIKQERSESLVELCKNTHTVHFLLFFQLNCSTNCCPFIHYRSRNRISGKTMKQILLARTFTHKKGDSFGCLM